MGGIFSWYRRTLRRKDAGEDPSKHNEADCRPRSEEGAGTAPSEYRGGESSTSESNLGAGADSSESNIAVVKVKKGLCEVKVSKHDATEMQRKLEGELFDKWEEGCEVMETKGIPVADITPFLDYMQEAYGLDDATRKAINGIHFGKDFEHKVMEFKYNKGDNSKTRYGMVAFGKSDDRQFVDCMYVLYKIDFKIAPQRIVTETKNSYLWGFIEWTTTEEEKLEREIGATSMKMIQNFFRAKALRGFYEEGLIDSINYVPSLEDVEELQ